MDEQIQDNQPTAESRNSRLQYGIATLLLTTTLVAVLLTLVRWAPGIGLFLVVFVTPAFVRATIVAAREKSSGRRLTVAQKMYAFLAAVGLTVATALAFGLAFYITCWGAFIVSGGGNLSNLDFALRFGIVCGVLGQLVFLVFFIRWLWRRRGQQRNRLGDIGFTLSWASFVMIYWVAALQIAGKNSYGNDGYSFGLPAIPGLVLSLVALCQPRRSTASVGAGLGLAACIMTAVFFSVTKYGPRSRTPDSLVMLGFTMAICLVLAIAVPSIVWWLNRRQPAPEVIHETPERETDEPNDATPGF